jgi:hypothetical protein
MNELKYLLRAGATLQGVTKSAGELISAISATLKNEGKEEKDFDLTKAIEVKNASRAIFETKANEVVHTGNTGYGAELVPGAVQTTDFLDLAPILNPLLGAFRGFHGRNLNKIQEVPVIGELPLHQLAAEWTSGAPTAQIIQGLGKLPTAKVTLNQKKFLFSVDVSDEEVRFVNVLDVLATIQKKLGDSSARTTISAIINGDTVTTANTNINLIDGTPTGTEHYLAGNGLRKTAFSGSTAFDAGSLDFGDFITLLNYLNEKAADPTDVLFIFGRTSYNTALNITEFKSAYMNGTRSTIVTGALQNFLGADCMVNRYLTQANTAGKISATPANNSKGQVLCVHKDAVQYGYNGEYAMELYRVPGYGWQVLGYYYLGFAIVSATAGQDPMVSLAYNVS